MTTYDNSVRGICQWACDVAGVEFNRLSPEHVEILLHNGRVVRPDEPGLKGEDIFQIHLHHPDAKEVISIQIGQRSTN